MKWDEFIKDYLKFTRKERIGILVVAGLILLLLFLPDILKRSSVGEPAQIDTTWIAAIKSLEIKDSTGSDESYREDGNTFTYQYDRKKTDHADNSAVKTELFYFDPNTASPADWKRLGLRDKTIQTIQNYLTKGGHFYKPGNLQRIYGLHKDDYERLIPYVRIEAKIVNDNEQFPSSMSKDETQTVKTYTAKYAVVDINTADTSAFIALPGIGNKLASRIVNFREKLGGFYSIDQIGEIYGLADSTFQKMKQYLTLGDPSVRKMNINTATVDELKTHPYIRLNIASPIVSYRTEHGLFSKLEDIKNVMAITDEVYKKIVPYLTVQ